MQVLSSDKAAVAHPDKLFIGGRWRKPAADRWLRLINPSTEKEFAAVVEAGPEEVELAVSAARRAFDKGPWPRMEPAERARYMRSLASALIAREHALDSCWITQVGVPLSMAQGSARASL